MTDIPAGWPCALLPANPPSVADKLAAPTADDLLPQLLQMTPRGPAWGTDEAGPGPGANPVMLGFWCAIAARMAWNYGVEYELATQCFPSAISYSLEDWETELGLPDTCFSGSGGSEQRIAAVRARFAAVGGQSPAYFVCLAASIGYTITIEEPTQFLVDVSEVGPDPLAETWFLIDDGAVSADSLTESWFLIDESEVAPDPIVNGVLQPEGDGDRLESYALAPSGDGDPLEGFQVAVLDDATAAALEQISDETVWKYWIVHIAELGDTWFRIDEGELAPDSIVSGVLQPKGAGDPLEGFLTAQDLECELRRLAPPHTELVFSYDVAA